MSAQPEANPTTEFLSLRPRLFAVAYRMLGTVSDAEDIVQEGFLRWQKADRRRIDDATGYLIRIVTNLCLDRLRAAKTQRESYTGEWLPEPIVTSDATESVDHNVSVALLLVLERLTPLERAAFLLHDVFDTDYADVSEVLDRSPATCRQLVKRARAHVQDARPRHSVTPSEGKEITLAFFQAARTGDTDALTQMLSDQAQLIADGGDKVVAVRRMISGRENLTRLFAGVAKLQGGVAPDDWRFCHLNGLPAILSREADPQLVQATAVEIEDGRIARVYIVRNPEKTAHLASELGLSL